MTRQEQVEQVLRLYLSDPYTIPDRNKHLAAIEHERDWVGLITDLLAFYPTVGTREALEKILLPHRGLSDESARASQDELLDRVMSWALGQPERPVWCEHLTWIPEKKCWAFYDEDNFDYAEWDGKRCPFKSCRTPRPQEPSHG